MVPVQRLHAFPQNLQVPTQPTTGPEPPSRMQTPVATSVEIPVTRPGMQPQQMDGRQASLDVSVQQGVLTDNKEDHTRSTQQDNMGSSVINQDSQTGRINPGLPNEHSADDVEVIVIYNDSTKTNLSKTAVNNQLVIPLIRNSTNLKYRASQIQRLIF